MRDSKLVSGLVLVLIVAGAHGVFAANPKEGGDAAAPAAVAHSPALGGMPAGFALPGIPVWQPPAEYSVDMVMTHGDQGMTMHRSFRNGSIRTDMAFEKESMSMIEKADEPGTTYNLMPSRKMAMKTSADAMENVPGAAPAKTEEAPKAEEKPVIESAGTEKIDGHDATKFKITSGEHHALMWFDAATGAPLKMEGEGSQIEWKNLEVKPQPASNFEVPKEYQVMDMGEQMKKMQAMMAHGGAMGPGGTMAMGGGMPMGGGPGSALSSLGGGGMGGGVPGMAGGFGHSMGQNFGQQIGSSIGASFGGPIGAMAGSYIGGKVGGWLGQHTATALTGGAGGAGK